MHRAAKLALVAASLLPCACAAATPTAVPPVVELPVPPAGSPRLHAAQSNPPSSPQPQPPWVETLSRRAKTKKVTGCQIVPYTFGSTTTVENRLLPDGTLAVRVIRDDESALGVNALPVLLGKGYVASAAAGGARVVGSDGAPAPDLDASRIRALASGFLGWPGRDVASHPPAHGAEVATLEPAIAAVLDVPLHGGELPTTEAKVSVTMGAVAADALTFDLVVTAMEGDAGMCHRWENHATLKGTLRLRATTGALLDLHLEGPTDDTEALCMDPSGKPGPPPPPRTCNKGTMSIDVSQEGVP